MHQTEIDAIRKKAKQLADAGVTSYDDALERLSSQALRDVDGQYASSHPGADVQAQAWLDQVQAANPAGFDQMPLFQATRTDYNDPTKYAGTKLTNPDIYTAANRPPIPGTLSPTSPSLSAIVTGNAKALGNFGADLFNRALDLAVGDAGPVGQVLGLKDPGTSGQMPKAGLTPDESAAAQATGIMTLPFGAEDIGGLLSPSKGGGTVGADSSAATTNNFYRDGLPYDVRRLGYEADARRITDGVDEMRAAGVSEETIAKWAVEQRNDLKVTYRDMSPPDFVQAAEARNMEKYGNPIGPTIDQLRQKGLSWQQITDSAARPGGQDMGFGK